MRCMRKHNHYHQSNQKIQVLRNPIKNRINEYFKDDLGLDSNPFSLQLTPWNETSKLETSLNLLKKQAQKSQTQNKKTSQNNQSSVQHMAANDSLLFTNLAFPNKNPSPCQPFSINRTSCQLKASSQQVVVPKNQKPQSKRLSFHKKLTNEDKILKKIVNLTMQWDQDIVYNPQKKYLEQQSLKRKVLKEFTNTRIDNHGQGPNKDLRNQGKSFKLELKNNRIHRKQVSIFQFRKKQDSLLVQKLKSDDQRQKKVFQFLSINKTNKPNQDCIQGNGKKLNIELSRYRTISHQNRWQNLNESSQKYRSDKLKFRTSLKAKRLSPEKRNLNCILKVQRTQKSQIYRASIDLKSQKEILNKINLELHKDYKQTGALPMQILAKTSPHFFEKTIQ